MKLLELFAGSRSMGEAAESLGWEVFSVDWQPFEKINLSIDIEFLTPEHIPFIPDHVHMSPDCTSYSVAAISTHRNGVHPISEYAKKCDVVNQNALRILSHFLKLNTRMTFTIENPRGMLRKMPWMFGIDRRTVWYCQYGDTRAKPTDFWCNNFRSVINPGGWNPKRECFNSNRRCHHEASPRGSVTGTQGLKNDYERSRIPNELCIEILKSCHG